MWIGTQNLTPKFKVTTSSFVVFFLPELQWRALRNYELYHIAMLVTVFPCEANVLLSLRTTLKFTKSKNCWAAKNKKSQQDALLGINIETLRINLSCWANLNILGQLLIPANSKWLVVRTNVSPFISVFLLMSIRYNIARLLCKQSAKLIIFRGTFYSQ